MLSDTQRTRGDGRCRLCSSDSFHACISVGRRLSDDTAVRDSASFCVGASGARCGIRCKNSWSEKDANSATSSDASCSACVKRKEQGDIVEGSDEVRREGRQRAAESAEETAEKVTGVLLSQRRRVRALQVAVQHPLHDFQQTRDRFSRHEPLRITLPEGPVSIGGTGDEIKVSQQHAERHRRQRRSELVRRLQTAETDVQQSVERLRVLGHLRLRRNDSSRPR